MTITYEEALSTLSSMFSSYSSSQLDAVLRHHGGHMEHTVETLLAHTGSPDELIAKLRRGEVSPNGPSSSSRAAGAIDPDEELARQLAREDQQQQQERPGRFVPPGQRRIMTSNVTTPRTNTAAKQKKGRGTPTSLPDDFLRIPGRKYSQPQNATNGRGLTDEQLARMLQDELFQEELR